MPVITGSVVIDARLDYQGTHLANPGDVRDAARRVWAALERAEPGATVRVIVNTVYPETQIVDAIHRTMSHVGRLIFEAEDPRHVAAWVAAAARDAKGSAA